MIEVLRVSEWLSPWPSRMSRSLCLRFHIAASLQCCPAAVPGPAGACGIQADGIRCAEPWGVWRAFILGWGDPRSPQGESSTVKVPPPSYTKCTQSRLGANIDYHWLNNRPWFCACGPLSTVIETPLNPSSPLSRWGSLTDSIFPTNVLACISLADLVFLFNYQLKYHLLRVALANVSTIKCKAPLHRFYVY